MLRSDDIPLTHGDIVDGDDLVGFFRLELRGVVMDVNFDFLFGNNVSLSGKVGPATVGNDLVRLFKTPRRRKVHDLLEVLRAGAQKQAETARDSAQIPYMDDRSGKFDMPHPFPADPVVRHFDAATIADNAPKLGPASLVFAACAFVAFRGAKDTLAEQSVLFRTQRPVIDRLGLLDLSARQLTNTLRTRQFDPDTYDFAFGHYSSAPSDSTSSGNTVRSP